MIYYRYLFQNKEGLSPNEGLVYSALLSHSLISIRECYDEGGKFNIEYARTLINGDADEGVSYILYNPISTRKLSKLLNMSELTVRQSKENLESTYNLIFGETIACPVELLEMGYIDIPPDTGLRGRQLVFYGLLKDRSSLYHGVLDTWASKLAEKAGISKKNVYSLFAILEAKGLAERLENGKLRIR